MLSFEWSKNDECLEVHADEAGLTRLARVIEFLKSTQTPDHIHLMSENGVEMNFQVHFRA
jgi:hypothetical protein